MQKHNLCPENILYLYRSDRKTVLTDRTFHAVDSNDEPIEGLYVIGVEGAMLWSDVYTINVSGGCNANNVNSARTAVRNAVETLL